MTLAMTLVATGKVLDEIDHDGDEITYRTGDARSIIETRARTRDITPTQALDELDGWSNGYIAFSQADETKAFLAEMALKHLPGRHDQSSHGRGRRRSLPDVVPDVPDVPKPAAVAEPKPPKPRRAPKPPKPRPQPKPPAGGDSRLARAVATDVRASADEIGHLPPMGRNSGSQARQIAAGALDDVEAQSFGRPDVSAEVDRLRADAPGLVPQQLRERLRTLADLVERGPEHTHASSAPSAGTAVRSALRNARTAREVSAAAQKESEQITDAGVFFNLDGADTEVAKELAEGILRGLERFPQANLSRVRLSTDMRGDAMARVDGDEILISADWAGDPERYRDTLHHYHAEGHFVGDSPMATAIHEFGHIVALSGDSEKSAGKLLLTTARRRSVADSGVRDFVESQISTYAARNDPEMTAEAFADVMLNGDGASDLSKVIFKHVEAKYRQAVG